MITNNNCVNTIGFIFDTAIVKIKHKKKKVPKSSNSSSLTTVCTTYKDKQSSSSSNPYYSSDSVNLPCLKTSQFSKCSSSTCSSSTCSSSTCSSSTCSSSTGSSSTCSSLTSNFTIDSCLLDLNSISDLKSYSGTESSCSDKNNFIITSTNNYNINNKKYKNKNKNIQCIKPICYEPSICGEIKHKKKCSHKNKKKFKTDIFNKINKYCLIKLTKEHFMSSTLSVCTENKNECWNKFTENLYELLGSSFLITLTKCNIFRTLYCQLLKINYCACCEELKLFFRYNILPPKNIQPDCINTINNIDIYYKLEDSIYHNLKFYYDHEYNFNPRNFINI
jgi:hypothetical protein